MIVGTGLVLEAVSMAERSHLGLGGCGRRGTGSPPTEVAILLCTRPATPASVPVLFSLQKGLIPTISTNQLKNGNHIEVDGTIYKVVEFQHVKPGKGPAFVRTKLRRISDGNVIDKTFRAGEKFRSVRTEARKMQFLYADDTDAHFMDTESYEQMAVPAGALADTLRWTKPSDEVDVVFMDGQPSSIQLPSSVELEVTETEPGLRGDTASGGGSKPATVETGATIQVPLFVNIGDRVKIQTETGDYMSRV